MGIRPLYHKFYILFCSGQRGGLLRRKKPKKKRLLSKTKWQTGVKREGRKKSVSAAWVFAPKRPGSALRFNGEHGIIF